MARVSASMPFVVGIDQQHDCVGIAGAAPRRRRPWRGRGGAWARRCRACRRSTICASPRMATPSTRRRVVCTLGRDDRDLGADQPVDQGRLAGIGRADHRDEAAARRCPSRHAAQLRHAEQRGGRACSAARLDLPLAWRGALCRSTRTSTVKIGSCGGPLARTTCVDRQRQAGGLRPFLQRGLGVLRRLRIGRRAAPSSGARRSCRAGIEPGVEIDARRSPPRRRRRGSPALSRPPPSASPRDRMR